MFVTLWLRYDSYYEVKSITSITHDLLNIKICRHCCLVTTPLSHNGFTFLGVVEPKMRPPGLFDSMSHHDPLNHDQMIIPLCEQNKLNTKLLSPVFADSSIYHFHECLHVHLHPFFPGPPLLGVISPPVYILTRPQTHALVVVASPQSPSLVFGDLLPAVEASPSPDSWLCHFHTLVLFSECPSLTCCQTTCLDYTDIPVSLFLLTLIPLLTPNVNDQMELEIPFFFTCSTQKHNTKLLLSDNTHTYTKSQY